MRFKIVLFYSFGAFFSVAPYIMSYGQKSGIQGTITDKKGQPLPFAGISIQGANTGTISNSEGTFNLPLAPGPYTVLFHHLGFKTESRSVQIEESFKTLDITLEEQALSLRELQIGKLQEDPAYSIMRKAIAKARYHQLQIQSYSAMVYARSTAVPTKIPTLARSRFKKQGISEGVAFVNESVTKVDFKRPNSYTQKIISTRNSLDNNTPTPNEFIFASFYNPEVGGTVTPLSPRALSVYKFEYEGHFEDRGEIINKIKVTPKSFKQGVFKGRIYIIEDRWAIHSFDLETVWQGFNIQVKQAFAPAQNVWIPSSQHFDIKGSYLGFAGKFTYIVSLKYDQLQIDPTLKEDIPLVDTPKQAPAPALPDPKGLEQIMSTGDKVDSKKFRKIVREYEKEQRQKENPEYSSREIRRDSIIVEPLANKRDSIYWSTVRAVPLSPTELFSYKASDSIVALRARSERTKDTTHFKPHHLITGSRYSYGNNRYLTIGSALKTLNFNATEAFNFNLSAEWQKRGENRQAISINPTIHYSTGRNRLSPYLRVDLRKQDRRLSLDGGETIVQFNPENPIHPLLNTFYYLFLNENHLRNFQKQFAGIEYQQRHILDVADLTMNLQTGRRMWLQNLAKRGDFLWGDPLLSANLNEPEYASYPSFFVGSPNYFTTLSVRVDLRPWQKYSMRNGQRRFFNRQQPEFILQYRKGIKIGDSDVDYDLLEAGIRYSPKIFAASTLQLDASVGRFLNNRKMTLADMKHFMGNQTIFQLGDRLSSFRMLPYYYHSTGQNYIEGHASVNSPKLLLTQAAFLRMIGIKEFVQGHLLRTPYTGLYTEQVYGVEGILKIFRAELVSHFDQSRYMGLGFRLGTVFTF